MLQDLERGRAMEIDALVTAVQELGRRVAVRPRRSTPFSPDAPARDDCGLH